MEGLSSAGLRGSCSMSKKSRDLIYRVPRGGDATPDAREDRPPAPWDAINRVPTPFCATPKKGRTPFGTKDTIFFTQNMLVLGKCIGA